MHASIWRFRGDPDDLLRRYDAVIAEIPPANMRLHLCLRADDGIIVVDTCPDRETYEAFVAGAITGLFRPWPARSGGGRGPPSARRVRRRSRNRRLTRTQRSATVPEFASTAQEAAP